MKKIGLALSIYMLLTLSAYAQNVGIGTASPTEKLEVNGAIKIGETSNAIPTKGTIRWNDFKNDFEGYNGTAWVSLTAGKAAWGNQQSFATESDAAYQSLTANTLVGKAISGWGNWLAIGMPGYQTGYIYLYQYNNDGETRRRHQLSTSSDGNFGFSVAIHNNIVAAGSPTSEVDGKAAQGRVLISSFTESGYSTPQLLTASNGAANDQFGYSVALNENRLVVGAPYANKNLLQDAGGAYVFEKSGNTWQQTAMLTAFTAQANEYAGMTVAVWGDYIAVGAPSAKVSNISMAGKVFMFHYTGTIWQQETIITNPSPTHSDELGYSLQLQNDTLLIGMRQNSGSNGPGKVLQYIRNGSSWQLQHTLTPPDGKPLDRFGTSLHLNGDYLIVGAPGAEVGASWEQGKAYVYKKSNASWVYQTTLIASTGKYFDLFGNAVAILPNCAYVGAPNYNAGDVENSGEVFFFKR